MLKFSVLGVLALGLCAGEAVECDCLTSAPTATPPSTEETRTITIDNKCSFDVDLGFTGGFAGPAPCAQNQADFDGRCFWNLALPINLLESGDTMLIQIDKGDDPPENDVVWSGQIYGIQSPYLEEACPDGCGANKGPAGTVTLAEFTMLANPTLAYYDISNVHGANIPMKFGPSSSLENTYRNGVAGGDCSWVFEPPEEYRKYLIEVKNAHRSCSQDDECDADQGEVCGASFVGDRPVYGTCGVLFGYLNAHSNCIEGSVGYPFFCEKYHDLYGCSGQYSESGYSQSVTSAEHVCGCSDYSDLDIPSSFPCVNSNPFWIDIAYPWIEYVKKGCPSTYEYAFSDSTSTFTSDGRMLELIFCPVDSEQSFYG